MKPDDYIRGARHGHEAHDLELESMCDPLLADALDGFDAVPGEPGEHSAAMERLAEGIARSASEGRVAARARTARLRERRIRGWSVASAAVLLAAVAGGGVWMLRNGVRTDDSPTLANHTSGSVYRDEAVEILPPVTAIIEDTAQETPVANSTPLPAPTDMSEMMLDGDEIPVMSGIAGVMADAVVLPDVVNEVAPEAEAVAEAEIAPEIEADSAVVLGFAAEALAVRSQAARAVEISAPARVESQAKIQAETPARDTTQTDAFRRHVAGRNRERSAVMGPVTISFEVGADGRPRDVRIVESPTPELGEFARSLLDDGPDWPAEPSHKLITLNL